MVVYNRAVGIRVVGVAASDLLTEGGFSLDSRSADKEPKNQNWLFLDMKYFFHFNQFGIF